MMKIKIVACERYGMSKPAKNIYTNLEKYRNKAQCHK